MSPQLMQPILNSYDVGCPDRCGWGAVAGGAGVPVRAPARLNVSLQ